MNKFCPVGYLCSVYSYLMMLSFLCCYLASLLPLWGLLGSDQLEIGEIRKKKTCVSEITAESGFSLVVLNAMLYPDSEPIQNV